MELATLEAANSNIGGSGWACAGRSLCLGMRSCPEPPGTPRGGAGAQLGHCIAKGGVLCMLRLHRCASLRQMLRMRARGGRSEGAARSHLRLFVG